MTATHGQSSFRTRHLSVTSFSVQHELGIYGSPAGSNILALLPDVYMPVVTTFHPVLREPDTDQRTLMKQLNELSNRFIVMAEQGKGFLKEIYGTIKLITYRTVIQSSESAIQMLPPARGGY